MDQIPVNFKKWKYFSDFTGKGRVLNGMMTFTAKG